MNYRELGRTGVRVSPIGLGTAKFGRIESLGLAREPDALPSDAQVAELLAVARSFGVNLLDTAPAYGSSEARLASGMGEEPFIVVTKTGEHFEDGTSRFDFSAEATRASVLASARRLERSVLDVVLLHSDGRDVEILKESGALEELLRLRSEGKVRAIGASTKTVEGGLLAVELCDVVMVTLNEADATQLPVVEAAQAAGVGLLVKKPLAKGHARDPGAALRKLCRVPGVSSVVVGTTDSDHLRENCRTALEGLD